MPAIQHRTQKLSGAYFTPDFVVQSLVSWATRGPTDRLLDPACGDGRFLTAHPNSVGVEQDADSAAIVHRLAPGCLIHQGDFFAWATQTSERFNCAAGNPPFIRYQRFCGEVRDAAQKICSAHGANFSSLSSSWAPFIVATATLLHPGGRMAFVVPAEIGHATYAAPVIEYLCSHFARITIVAVRHKLFPDLSEDCWLLYAEDFGLSCQEIKFVPIDQFTFTARPPSRGITVSLKKWKEFNCRLRPFLLRSSTLDLYEEEITSKRSVRFGEVAKVGIGYVTGDNGFFHLRPSEAASWAIPEHYLHPTVRSGRSLNKGDVTNNRLEHWRRQDDAFLLLRLRKNDRLTTSVSAYLNSQYGIRAQRSYKCQNRDPWWSVPDVVVPDAFVSYMSGGYPSFVSNYADCAGTNSVHVVRLNGKMTKKQIAQSWTNPMSQLSCELEGHPLGGGMLKMEPREVSRVLLSRKSCSSAIHAELITEALDELRRWRHYAGV